MSRRNPRKLEFSQEVVVLGHCSLPLVNLDQDAGLIVRVGSESLRLLGRDRGVAFDESGHHATGGLYPEGQRSHVQEQQILYGFGLVTLQYGRLHCRPVRHSLVRIYRFVKVLSIKKVLSMEGKGIGISFVRLKSVFFLNTRINL